MLAIIGRSWVRPRATSRIVRWLIKALGADSVIVAGGLNLTPEELGVSAYLVTGYVDDIVVTKSWGAVGRLLDGRCLPVGAYRVCGIGGVDAVQSAELLVRRYSSYAPDLLITSVPPKGFMDYNPVLRVRVGSLEVREAVRVLRPKALVYSGRVPGWGSVEGVPAVSTGEATIGCAALYGPRGIRLRCLRLPPPH